MWAYNIIRDRPCMNVRIGDILTKYISMGPGSKWNTLVVSRIDGLRDYTQDQCTYGTVPGFARDSLGAHPFSLQHPTKFIGVCDHCIHFKESN